MTNKGKVLVIDDESSIRLMLKAILPAKGFQVFMAATGANGCALAVECQPDLILLGLRRPGMVGYQVCQSLREWYHGFIFMLSALEREEEKLHAFRLGADDYLTKPFSLPELLARVEARLRRASMIYKPDQPIITIGNLSVDVTRHQVFLDSTRDQTDSHRI